MGQTAGPNEASGGVGENAGSGQAFGAQAEGASGSGVSSPASGTGFGTAGDQGPGSGGQAAGQFSPLSGNHSEGDQSNSGVQPDAGQPAHHVDASVQYVHIDPLPDVSHHLHF